MSPQQTHAASRAVTRDDLIAFGRAGRPRDFIPVALRALDAVPGDHVVRALLGANIAQLGLKTLAREALAGLAEAAAAQPDVRMLAAAIEKLPDDVVPARVRLATALGNLRALRVRGLDLAPEFEAWRARLSREDCFRCADGNLVRRSRRPGAPCWTSTLIDQRGAAERYEAAQLRGAGPFPRPLAIEGLDPPWLLDRAWRALARNPVGYAPPITVVQADALELLDGLSALDLREHLVDPRVRVFVGPDAAQRWLNDALERLDEAVIGTAVAIPGVRARVTPSLEAAVGRVSAAQAEEFRRVQTRVDSVYRGRDAAWWARRYAEAGKGGPPLRVLIPTSRYSTYVRHAAEDLAGAFRALGCEAMVAIEQRSDSRPSALGHARSIDRFQPDLIALINYFRGDAGLPFPRLIPWLCWMQDALPHQFADRTWGELDFVAGHVHKELLGVAGFPQDRAMQFPVVASERKFHAAPFAKETLARLACEVAYVSHQSETPEAFHRRIMRENGTGASARVLEELRPLIATASLDPTSRSLVREIELLTQRVADGAGGVSATYVFRHYALPLADRVLRHQMLAWAAEICERRGWRLRIYGRGWETHPTLARFARGEVAHGEDLRACYQASLTHLHASVNTPVHQRVMECSLSGGLPLARLTYDAVSESTGWGQREALLRGPSPLRDDQTGKIGLAVASSPALASIAQQRARLGMPLPDVVWISPARAESYRRPDNPCASGLHAAWLFGDLCEGTFRSQAELESLIERAVHDPAWRRERSQAMASRVREQCTVEVFARQALQLIRSSLAPSAAGRDSIAA